MDVTVAFSMRMTSIVFAAYSCTRGGSVHRARCSASRRHFRPGAIAGVGVEASRAGGAGCGQGQEGSVVGGGGGWGALHTGSCWLKCTHTTHLPAGKPTAARQRCRPKPGRCRGQARRPPCGVPKAQCGAWYWHFRSHRTNLQAADEASVRTRPACNRLCALTGVTLKPAPRPSGWWSQQNAVIAARPLITTMLPPTAMRNDSVNSRRAVSCMGRRCGWRGRWARWVQGMRVSGQVQSVV